MNLACVLHGPLQLSVESFAVEELGPSLVRVRLGAAGICGSDLHYYQHGRAGVFAIRAPFVPGHEASGIVDAVGSDVTKVQVGQKVAVNPSHPCGSCFACKSGRSNLCAYMKFLGSAAIFPHIAGLFREQFVVHEDQLTAIAEDVSLGEIACAEPLSIGLHAVKRAGPLLGASVMVTGAGTIGCMSAMSARLAGAAHVIVCDPSQRARGLAVQIGADEVYSTASDYKKSVDVVLEAAGHPAALLAGIACVRRGGKVVQIGTLPAEVNFPANEIMSRELDYLGAFRADIEFDWAVQAIRSRQIDVRPLISAQLPISQSKTAFDLALDRGRSTKVQLVAD